MNVYEVRGAATPRMVAASNRRAAVAHVARSMNLRAEMIDALRAIELTKAGVEVEHVGAEEAADDVDDKEGEASQAAAHGYGEQVAP